jgi:hypothetical protein
MKTYRVQAIVSHVEFIDVQANSSEEAEELAKNSDDWTTLEPGDFEIDHVGELKSGN